MATLIINPEDTQPKSDNTNFLLLYAIAGSVLLLAHLPLITQHLLVIWKRPHYQFFPFVLLGVGVLGYLRFRPQPNQEPVHPGNSRITYVGFFLSWLLLAAGELLYSSWLGAISALFTLAVVLYAIGGISFLKRGLPCLVLLFLIVPPPFELDRTLILSLKSLTTQWSSRLLDYVGVYHLLSGNVVEIPGERLLVEDACSGINSLFSLTACTVFLVFFYRRGWLHGLLLIGSCILWVLLSNVLRVFIITYCISHWEVDLSEGWRHEALGMGLFVVALLMVWSTDRFFLFLFHSREPSLEKSDKNSKGESPVPSTKEEKPTTGSWITAPLAIKPWVIILPFALILVFHLTTYGFLLQTDRPDASEVIAKAESLQKTSLPAEIQGWNQDQYFEESRTPGSAFGEFSKIWTYKKGGVVASLSLDYPYPEWHQLTYCYTSQGWFIQKENECMETSSQQGQGIGFMEVELTKPASRSGYLLFAQFNGEGEVLQPRYGGARLSLRRHFVALNTWNKKLQGEDWEEESEGPVYQFQLITENFQELSPVEKQETQRLFLEGLKHLLQKNFPAS